MCVGLQYELAYVDGSHNNMFYFDLGGEIGEGEGEGGREREGGRGRERFGSSYHSDKNFKT